MIAVRTSYLHTRELSVVMICTLEVTSVWHKLEFLPFVFAVI